ncbi:hypothetical protein JCM9279_002016 [Rhodotorula babjevae]
MAQYTLTRSDPRAQAPAWTARTPPLSPAFVVAWFLLVVAFLSFVLVGWTRSWCAAGAALVLSSLATRTTETITALPSLGLQLSHKRDLALFPFSFSVASREHLVPLERIDKVVINEGLQGAAGRAYLAVVEGAQGERSEGERVHVVFPSILPHLKDLVPVLQRVQAVLKFPK